MDKKVSFACKLCHSDHPFRPDLRFPDDKSWPGWGQRDKWTLCCVSRMMCHSLFLSIFLRRPLDKCFGYIQSFPGGSLPHLLVWSSNRNAFYLPSFYPGEPWLGQPCAVLCPGGFTQFTNSLLSKGNQSRDYGIMWSFLWHFDMKDFL